MMKMNQNFGNTAMEMHHIPTIHSTLISTYKLIDVNCIIELDKDSTKISDGTKAKIVMSERAMMEDSGLLRALVSCFICKPILPYDIVCEMHYVMYS